MYRRRTLIALSLGLVVACAFVAPGYAMPKSSSAPSERGSPAPRFQVLAQAGESGIEAQEQQLQRQIQSDNAKLKADEAAERAGQKPLILSESTLPAPFSTCAP
jgi:hypothetical protein